MTEVGNLSVAHFTEPSVPLESRSLPISPAELIQVFHSRFGIPLDVTTTEYNHHRAELIREEAQEAVEALEASDPLQWAKELADLVLVAYGAAAVLGIDLDRAVALVHASNMTKLGPDGHPVLRPSDGKVVKGPGSSSGLAARKDFSVTAASGQVRAGDKLRCGTLPGGGSGTMEQDDDE